MQPGFDPYREWLGIETGPRPPDHYTLLALAPREEDARRIAQAADAQSAKVRGIRPGPHLAEWSRLLDLIQAAKVCLLNPESKAAYDASLTGPKVPGSGPGAPATPSPHDAPTLATPPSPSGPILATPPGTSDPAPPQPGTPSPPLPAWQSKATSQPAPASPPSDAVPPASPATSAFPAPVPAPGEPSSRSEPPWRRDPPGSQQPAAPGPSTGSPQLVSQQPWTSSPQPMSEESTARAWASAPVPLGSGPVAPGGAGGDPSGIAASSAPVPSYAAAGQSAQSGGPAREIPRAIPVRPSSAWGSAWAAALTATVVLLIVGLGAGFVYLRYHEMGMLGSAAPSPGQADTERGPAPDESPLSDTPAQATADAPAQPQAGTQEGVAPGGSTDPESEGPGQRSVVGPGVGQGPAPGSAGPEQSAAATQPGTRPGETPATGHPPSSADPSGGPGSSGPAAAAAEDAQKRAAFDQAVAAARESMGARDMAAARQQLRQAQQAAQSQADFDQVTRLETMVNILEEFWRGVREGVASLGAGSELQVGDTYVAVVESSPQHLLIKAAGRLRSWRVEELPTSLVLAVAQQYFREDAVKKLLIGTFLLVDPKGDPARARQLWQEAARGQTGVDVKLLMPELDAAPAGSGPGAVPAGSGHSGPGRQPRPTGAELQAAEEAVRERFAQQFADMLTPAGRLSVARELLSAARGEQDPAQRFVMLQKAVELAAAAGDVPATLEALDHVAGDYAIDAEESKLSALEQLERNARSLSTHRDVAIEALKLLQQAIEGKDAECAQRLAELATAAARGSRNIILMRQAVQLEQAAEALGGG